MSGIRLAVRSLLQTPLVAGVAILSLALGIGANAAIFTIFERVILRPLPVPEAERLVLISSPGPKPGSQSSNSAGPIPYVFSYPMFRDLQRQQTSFVGLAGYRIFGANLAHAGSTVSGEGLLVSGNYFRVLGVEPTLGRLFDPGDDRTAGGGHPLAVLGHAYWRSAFNADPAVLNTTLVVNGQPLIVVGVAPPGFFGTTLGLVPKVFVPLGMREVVVPGWKELDNRSSYWVYLLARLRPGVTMQEAAASLSVPYRAILREVEGPMQDGLSEGTLQRFVDKPILLEEGSRGRSDVQAGAKIPLLLLLGVTGLVLLIACANIANLLLTRATDRSAEMAVRLSLGARPRHLLAQLLSESFVLALLGGALGLLVALGTIRFFLSILPPEAGSSFDFGVGPATWWSLLLLVLLTGLVGLAPALHSLRRDLTGGLKNLSGYGTGSVSAARFRTLMATLQIAMSMALLISAGLFSKSLLNVTRVELGLEIEQLATFSVSPELNGYEPGASRVLFERLESELEALPGVTGATASMVPLIAGSNWGSNVTVQGYPTGPDVDTHSNFDEIGPGYFRTLGVPLLAGREFDSADAVGTPKVAIVNQAFARKFGLGREAVGKRMQVGSGGELDIEIVGLVQDTKYSDVKQATPPVFFLPYRQDESLGSLCFYVRSAGDPEKLLETLRGTVARLDRNLPIENLRTMEMQIERGLVLDRILGSLSTAFALVATFLAAIGLYGVVAYAVARRSREIGLRMALGADGNRVRQLVFRQVGLMAVPGTLLGMLAALGLGRLARSLLFELEGHDPVVFLVAFVMLCGVTLAAGLPPASRAARIDPMQVLRDE